MHRMQTSVRGIGTGLVGLVMLAGCGAAAPRPQKLVVADKLIQQGGEQSAMSKIAAGLLLEAKDLHKKAVAAYEDDDMQQAEYYATLATLAYNTGVERVRIARASDRLTAAETRSEEAAGVQAEAEQQIADLAPHVERMERLAKMGNQEQQLRKELEAQQARLEAEKKQAEVQNMLALLSGKLDTADALHAQKYDAENVETAKKNRDEAAALVEKDPDKAKELLTAADTAISAAITKAREAFAQENAKLDMLKERKALLDQASSIGDVEAVQTDRGVVITVRQLFAGGKAEILENRQDILTALAELANKYEKYPVLVHGYTDARGRNEANLALSAARAQSVEDYLAQHNVALDRLKSSGYGEAEPVADNRSREGRAKNRRVEVVFVFP